jgi:hypothetical protein
MELTRLLILVAYELAGKFEKRTYCISTLSCGWGFTHVCEWWIGPAAVTHPGLWCSITTIGIVATPVVTKQHAVCSKLWPSPQAGVQGLAT